jgi:hypothetical protein
VDGILGHSLLLSRAFLVGIPSWVGFEATTCCCLRPFWWESLRGWDFLGHNLLLSQAFSSRWNFGYHEAFLTNFLFSRWNSGYHTAFLTNFLFHDGILAITKPFSRTLFFHGGILAITEPFSRTLFLFSRCNSGYHEAFLTNFLFHDGILEIRDLGEDSFHIYIYHKEYLHRIRLVKNLAS